MAETLARVRYEQFFDRDVVKKAVNKAKRKRYAMAGGLVRVIARRSIRSRNKSSEPGRPPSSHQGDYKRSIFYGFDKDRDSVLIGPRADYGSRSSSATTVPELLEFGGDVFVKKQLMPVEDENGVRQNTRWRRYTGRLHYEARPHMGPALEKALPKFTELWANSIRG